MSSLLSLKVSDDLESFLLDKQGNSSNIGGPVSVCGTGCSRHGRGKQGGASSLKQEARGGLAMEAREAGQILESWVSVAVKADMKEWLSGRPCRH